MQTEYFMTQHRRFCNSNNTAPLASWNNVPQSIICGDDAAVPLPHNPPHALAMLYCYTILYSNASVTIICRLIVSKWEIRFQVIIGYAAPFSLIPFLSCPYSLISFLLTLNSSQNLLLSILMMGHSRVAFGDVKGKTSIPFLDILPLSLSLSLSELSLSFHHQVHIKISSLRLRGTLSNDLDFIAFKRPQQLSPSFCI